MTSITPRSILMAYHHPNDDQSHGLLHNRHTGEILEISRERREGEMVFRLSGTLFLEDEEGFVTAGTCKPNRPPLFYLAHVALRHRQTQTILVMPTAIQAVLFQAVVAVGSLFGRYRGTAWPGCPARCTGAPEPVALDQRA